MRIPLLSGTSLVIASAHDDAVVIAPPPPPSEAIADVAAAIRDALRFPLAGPPLDAVVSKGDSVTILTEPLSLPVPDAAIDPRQAAISATVAELRRLGVPDSRQTILVAGGLTRRPGRRELERLFPRAFARGFRGQVKVHDVEDPRLVEVAGTETAPLRSPPELVERDAVVIVSAAETVLHGGPALLLAAGGPEALRAAHAASLLQPRGSSGWRLALALEEALSRRVPLLGLSLALDHPRMADATLGYPYERDSLDRLAGSRLVRLFRLLPTTLRARVVRSLPLSFAASAVFAGPPSVAHAEALLRAVESRSVTLDRPLDAVCLGVAGTSPHLPRERPNPLLASYLALGYALQLWREQPLVRQGGTAILAHGFHRHFAHPTQQPYRAFFQATRTGLDGDLIAEAERTAATDERALALYQSGRSCHPLLPFADWAACADQIAHLGAVLVAGCRDAGAARQLGFVPCRGVGVALEMVEGGSEGGSRIGFLLTPPYFPVRVGS